MTQFATLFPRQGLQFVNTALSSSVRALSGRFGFPVPARNVATLCATLMILQVLDGILTAVGVSLHGVDMEGNPLIRGLMVAVGPIPALIFVKSLAMAVVAGLYMLSGYIDWMVSALRTVVILYLCAAIIPWSVILVSRLA